METLFINNGYDHSIGTSGNLPWLIQRIKNPFIALSLLLAV